MYFRRKILLLNTLYYSKRRNTTININLEWKLGILIMLNIGKLEHQNNNSRGIRTGTYHNLRLSGSLADRRAQWCLDRKMDHTCSELKWPAPANLTRRERYADTGDRFLRSTPHRPLSQWSYRIYPPVVSLRCICLEASGGSGVPRPRTRAATDKLFEIWYSVFLSYRLWMIRGINWREKKEMWKSEIWQIMPVTLQFGLKIQQRKNHSFCFFSFYLCPFGFQKKPWPGERNWEKGTKSK